MKVALAEGQLTILDSGLQPGQNVVVDGADRLRARADCDRERGPAAQRPGRGGTGRRVRHRARRGGPSWRPAGSAARPAKASGKHDKREQQ